MELSEAERTLIYLIDKIAQTKGTDKEIGEEQEKLMLKMKQALDKDKDEGNDKFPATKELIENFYNDLATA